MTSGIRIDDDIYDWLWDHKTSKHRTISDVIGELIEFKENNIDFSKDELNLISCALNKLDCSVCILDCDESDENYSLCDLIKQKIGI